jgi:hypothetical protein
MVLLLERRTFGNIYLQINSKQGYLLNLKKKGSAPTNNMISPVAGNPTSKERKKDHE